MRPASYALRNLHAFLTLQPSRTIMDSVIHSERNAEGFICVTRFDPADAARMLPLAPVTSSRLAAIGYAEDLQLLFIGFPNGGIYEYAGVESITHEEMLESESIGKFFNEYIAPRGKPAPYRYRKVEPAGESASPMQADAPIPIAAASASAALEGEVMIAELPAKDEELKGFAARVWERAKAIFIGDSDSYTKAANELTTIKATAKTVEARLNRVYDPAFKAYKEALALKQEALAPYALAETAIKNEMLAFNNREKDRIRKLEAEQTRIRQEQAQAEAKEKGRQIAEQEAQYAEAQGEPEQAASIRATPPAIAAAPVQPVVLESSVPRGGRGMPSVKENWQWRDAQSGSLMCTFLPQIAFALEKQGLKLDPVKLRLFAGELQSIIAPLYSRDEKKISERAKKLKLEHGMEGIEVFDAGTIASR